MMRTRTAHTLNGGAQRTRTAHTLNGGAQRTRTAHTLNRSKDQDQDQDLFTNLDVDRNLGIYLEKSNALHCIGSESNARESQLAMAGGAR